MPTLMSVSLACSQSAGGGSDWADFLESADTLEYVSPDVDRCLAEHHAFEVDQELDLTGDEFLLSPPVLPSITAVDARTRALVEAFVSDSPVRPALSVPQRTWLSRLAVTNPYVQRAHKSLFMMSPEHKRRGLRDITNSLPNNTSAPASAQVDLDSQLCVWYEHSAKRATTIPRLRSAAAAATREDPGAGNPEVVNRNSTRPQRACSEKERVPDQVQTRPGRYSLDTPERPRATKADKRRCQTARKSKDCLIYGCSKGARSKGLCKRHGGGKRCTHPSCTRSDQGGGFCIAHGGGEST